MAREFGVENGFLISQGYDSLGPLGSQVLTAADVLGGVVRHLPEEAGSMKPEDLPARVGLNKTLEDWTQAWLEDGRNGSLTTLDKLPHRFGRGDIRNGHTDRPYHDGSVTMPRVAVLSYATRGEVELRAVKPNIGDIFAQVEDYDFLLASLHAAHKATTTGRRFKFEDFPEGVKVGPHDIAIIKSAYPHATQKTKMLPTRDLHTLSVLLKRPIASDVRE